jgi:hypothetical protein
MAVTDEVEAIVKNTALNVQQKSERVTALLGPQADLGAAGAVECLLTTKDAKTAIFASHHLGLLAGLNAEKSKVVERMISLAGEFLRAVTPQVRFLAPPLINRLVSLFAAGDKQRSNPIFGVVYEIALYFPAVLRPLEVRDPLIELALLSGAPDSVVEETVRKLQADHKPVHLETLARIHTKRAQQALLAVRGEIDAKRLRHWESCLARAGRFPEGGEADYAPASQGFVVRAGSAPHPLGGKAPAPRCPKCSTVAERVVTLRSGATPFPLATDASFYWWRCTDGPPAVTVGPNDPLVAGDGDHVVPTGALKLEPHPNQAGIAADATGGNGRHHVGGPPRQFTIEPFPRCPRCQAPMRFIVNIDAGMTPLGRVGFSGMLYGYWCAACSTSTTTLRS